MTAGSAVSSSPAADGREVISVAHNATAECVIDLVMFIMKGRYCVMRDYLMHIAM